MEGKITENEKLKPGYHWECKYCDYTLTKSRFSEREKIWVHIKMGKLWNL